MTVRLLRQRRTLVVPILLLFALLLSACSGNTEPAKQEDPRPSNAEIKQALTTEFPSFVQLASFTVEVMENMGTKVDPDWRARFHATAQFTEDTFTLDGKEGGVVFVQRAKRQGDILEIFGKSRSQLFAGAWKTSFDLDGKPFRDLGNPDSSFAPGQVIIRGSQAEADYFAKKEEERRLTQERVRQERIKMLEAAPQLLIGAWLWDSWNTIFFEDGAFATHNIGGGGGTWRGDWDVTEDILTVRAFYLDHSSVERYRIVEVNSKSFVVVSLTTGRERGATRLDGETRRNLERRWSTE